MAETEKIAPEEEVASLRARLARAAADLENLRKRAQAQREEDRRAGRAAVLREALTLLDTLQAARSSFSAGSADPSAEGSSRMFRTALETLHDLFERFFQSQGVRPVPAEGMYDPARHEVVDRRQSPEPAGTILEVLQTGYLLDGTLLRPARVRISAGPEALVQEPHQEVKP